MYNLNCIIKTIFKKKSVLKIKNNKKVQAVYDNNTEI